MTKKMPKNTKTRGASMTEILESFVGDPDLAEFDIPFRLQLVRYGERVRAARKARNWTQKDLEAKTGLTQPNISAIEAGTKDEGPTFKTMSRLASALGAKDLMQFEVGEPQPDIIVDPAFPDFLKAGGAGVLAIIETAISLREKVQWAQDTVVAIRRLNEHYQAETINREAAATMFPNGHVQIDGFAEPFGADAPLAKVNATRNYLVFQSAGGGAMMAVNVTGKD